MTHQHFVGEHEVVLVQPQFIGTAWSKETDIFRSSVWDMDGNPVSLSFRKFFNWDEKPELYPAPKDLTGATMVEKLDGCCDGDTTLVTTDGEVTIREICDSKFSGKVLGFCHTTNKQKFTQIKAHSVKESPNVEWYELELEDGKKIKLTGNHRVWVKNLNCYRRVDELRQKDELKSINKIQSNSKLYDVQTDTKNFFANGILVHNSTLIFSRYKGHTVVRTRGTVNARLQPNGYEIDFLMEKYGVFIRALEHDENSDASYVFEWMSPTNRIVIDYGDEPDMALIAIINHENYYMQSQSNLDKIADAMELRRPRTFKYDSVAEMRDAVEVLRDQEGLCVYYNDGQNIRKVKSAHYLFLHRAKSEISSIDKVIDVYMDWHFDGVGEKNYTGFFAYLTEKFDFEIATMAQGHASRICDAMKQVNDIMAQLYKFAEGCRTMKVGPSTVTLEPKQVRKFAAQKILQAYGSTGRSSIIFKILDDKKVGVDDWKKILYQVLK